MSQVGDLVAAAGHALAAEGDAPAYSGGNAITLLRGGEALFPAMCEAIAAARHEIWIASYIFRDEGSVRQVSDALVAAARRGNLVSVVVDGFGIDDSWPPVQARLLDAGVHVAVFRPLNRWYAWLQPGQLRRMHHKLCVIDAAVAFVGGINLLDDRLDVRHGWSERPRLDFALRLRGPLAPAVHHTAQALWMRASLGSAWRDEMLGLASSAQPLARAKRLIARLRMTPRPPATAAEADPRPMRAALVVRDNLRRRRSIERSYLHAIRSARRSIDIVSAYFYPDGPIRHALRDAAQRGVRVRLLLQGRWDYRLAALAAHALADELIGYGVEIHEYRAAFLHAKVAVVDDDWATVGSSNIDPLSLLLNLEANVVVRDADFAAELRREIDTAIAASVPIAASRSGAGGLVRRGLVAWAARLYLRIAGVEGRY